MNKIAESSGVSVSSVYKILSDPFNFSQKTIDSVRDAARRCGLDATPHENPAHIKLGVVIPCRPAYFWCEAVEGMKRAQKRWESRLGKRVALVFSYYESHVSAENIRRLYRTAGDTDCDGYIIYPVYEPPCVDFIREKSRSHATAVLDENRAGFFSAAGAMPEGQLAFITSDNADEGVKAAAIIGGELPEMKHIVTLRNSDGAFGAAPETRIDYFSREARRINPDITITNMALEVRSKITPSFLARRLYETQEKLPIDCVYISSGVTNIACAAVEKIRRCFGRDSISAVCVGHESAPCDRKYLLNHTQKGYVSQDIFAEGECAVDTIMNKLVNSEPLRDRAFSSRIVTC